jgi:6-phosphogluconolactonase (cycloisomerase 2 family)
MAPATVAAGANPISVTIDPSGRYAYVANATDNTISQYAIDASGALSPTTVTPTVATQNGPVAITVTKGTAPITYTPKFAYVANAGGNTVSQYTIGANGALSAMAPATVAAGAAPVSVTVDPSGRYAYVANGDDNTVSQYTIGANGALSAMAQATVAAGTFPKSVTTTGTIE